jgi:membrane-bound lytic murein transglycosylase D
MQQQHRYATFAFSLLLGACAHAPGGAPIPPADPLTAARITRVMQTVESRDPSSDVAEKAAGIKAPVLPASGLDFTQFELPVQYNERVQEYVELYSVHRRTVFTTWLRRMGRYRHLIEERLEAEGLPRELVYLPLIESAFDANAASHASAVGLWQFMRGTARSEGLEVSEYVDERRDPIRSTDAAIQHLRGLYNYFGSWYLTAAAYNAGSTRVARLLKERGYAKGNDDAFWQMQDELPQETRNYVPKLLGAVIVAEHAVQFGIATTPDEPMRFDVVTVGGATELRAVARAANASYDDIKKLNPHFLKGITPPKRSAEVRVPVGAGPHFAEAFESIPKAQRTRALTNTYVVKRGDTLSGIARKHGTTIEAIKRVNAIKRADALAIGQKIEVPTGI